MCSPESTSGAAASADWEVCKDPSSPPSTSPSSPPMSSSCSSAAGAATAGLAVAWLEAWLMQEMQMMGSDCPGTGTLRGCSLFVAKLLLSSFCCNLYAITCVVQPACCNLFGAACVAQSLQSAWDTGFVTACLLQSVGCSVVAAA